MPWICRLERPDDTCHSLNLLAGRIEGEEVKVRKTGLEVLRIEQLATAPTVADLQKIWNKVQLKEFQSQNKRDLILGPIVIVLTLL